MRRVFSIKTQHISDLKSQLLSLSLEYSHFQFLDSNNYPSPYSQYDWLCAFDKKDAISPLKNEFEELFNFHQKNKDWLFGHLNYNLKNSLEKLNSKNPDLFEFANLDFFIPQTVVYEKNGTVKVESSKLKDEEDFFQFLARKNSRKNPIQKNQIELQAKTSKPEYLKTIDHLKQELQYGNIYEINYCIEFSRNHSLNPLDAFEKLQKLSPAPFASYYRNMDQYLICSSPERYLQKKGNTIISQPIKGTSKRSNDPVIDTNLKSELLKNEKERSENVMIVDLVRNDLSKTAKKKSVKVKELFGIYSYPTVHQMTSTISSEIDPKKTPFTAVLKHSFPMGSMTGAPKIKAMHLIEEQENFSRSLYSGAVGYIDPKGNFDFNVVIRSILYNAKTEYISARVGSAITILSEAEKEYEECLLKAQKLFEALN